LKTIKSSVIFPAFVPEFTGNEQKAISGFEKTFAQNLSLASQILRTDLTGFDFQKNNFLEDEERSQYISYLFSYTVAEILRKKKFMPAFLSGYSMGIYAAFCYAGSINFQTGLLLLQQAWKLISDAAAGGDHGMGMIVGLSEEDIQEMIGKKEVVICNQNNPHTYIISGDREGIFEVLRSAQEEGALRANPLPVSKPYHTNILEKAAHAFDDYLKKFVIKDPAVPIVSGLDTRILRTGGDIRQELIKNLYHRMDWLGAMHKLIDLGVEVFFECGPGDGLTRNFRFIDKSLKAFSVESIELFLSHRAH
jgi:[acyl-carrier-protein] S-malonyltransferase